MTLVTPLPNGDTTTGREIEDFGENLDETQANVEDLREKTGNVKTVVESTRWALEQVEEVKDQATEFLATIKSMQFALKLSGKVGPLKLPSKFVGQVLERLEDVAARVRDKAKSLDKKIKDGKYIEKLEDAEDKLSDLEDGLEVTEGKIEGYGNVVDTMVFAFDIVGSPLDGVENAANTASKPINDVLVPINRAYDDIEERLQGLDDAFAVAKGGAGLFDALAGVAKAFGGINSKLSILSGPLKAIQSALSPVEWVLDAVGFIYDITVGPVVDFLLDKLGVTAIMDRLGDEIAKLLPDVNVLDEMAARIDASFTDLNAFLGADGWNTDIDDYIADISADVLDALNSASPDAIRFGTDATETIHGRTGKVDVLNGFEGNDTLYGYASGDSAGSETSANLFIASAGEDFNFGGAGTDFLVLRGTLADYRISQFSDTAPVVFLDTQGRWGREVAEGIERFVFTDGVFTLQELKDLGVLAPAETNGDDLIIGGDDDDLIAPLAGSDTVDGRGGSDTILFPISETRNVDVQLQNPRTDPSGKSYDGSAWNGFERDYLDSIENVTIENDRDGKLFGTVGNNILISGAGDDLHKGLAGDDMLFGADGDDILVGGSGRDSIFGGAGNDIVFAGPAAAGRGELYDGGRGTSDRISYSGDRSFFNSDVRQAVRSDDLETAGPLVIDFAAGTVEHMDGDSVIATDTIVNFEYVIASDDDDIIYAAPNVDPDVRATFEGAGGNDTIYSGGADTVDGGAGSDLVIMTEITGTLRGGGGGGSGVVDVLDLRGVGDVRWLIRNGFNQTIDYYAYGDFEVENLGTQTGQPVGGIVNLGRGKIEGFEQILLGDGNDEFFAGGTARVEIFAAGGDDRLIRAQANDGGAQAFFHGGDGDDFLEFRVEGNEAYGDAGDDTLIINTSEDNVVISGGEGEDFIRITRMDGAVAGGEGYDVLSLEGRFTYRSELDLLLGTAAGFQAGRFGDQDYVRIEELTGIEEVIGGQEVSDVFAGSNEADRFITRGDNDTLLGRGGNDELFGGDGNDSLNGGSGDDVLHGGAGNDRIVGGFLPDEIDTASYANARFDGEEGQLAAGDFGSVIVDLQFGTATGAQGNDTLDNIENVIGSNGDDTLRGDGRDNVLSGGAGDDLLEGRAGDDVLVLGEGSDTARGGMGDDTFIIGLGNADVDGGDGFDVVDFGSVEGEITFDFDDFSFEANLLRDVPVWRDGGGTDPRVWNGTVLTPQDIIEAEAAFANSADDLTRALPGVDDPDRAQFEVVFDQLAFPFSGTFTNIEKLTTGIGDDTIIGSNADEFMVGAGGNDVLDGGRGDDTLMGDIGDDDLKGGVGEDLLESGAGNDFVRGGRGEDTIKGGGGHDALRGQRNADTMEGGSGDDNIKGGGGNDRLIGGSGSDFIKGGTRVDYMEGGTGDDRIFGNAFDDTLIGGSGNDRLNAGGGNDSLVGGTGRDTLKGGAGEDTFVFDLGDGRDTILDFQNNVDTLQFTVALTGGLTNGAAIVSEFADVVEGRTVFDFGSGQTIALDGVNNPIILADDIFVLG
ncbi:MAG: hypothetical protein AAFP13_13265 [Pseudomonadota bacterium]